MLDNLFGFEDFHHLVGSGDGGILLEEAGNDKDAVADADFGHAVGAAVGRGGDSASVLICHWQLLSMFSVAATDIPFSSVFISIFSLFSLPCAVALRKFLPVNLMGQHISKSLS